MAAKLGVLAGGGPLPARIVEACRATGREVFVLAFEGHTDPQTVADVEHAWSRLGAAGTALKHLQAAGVEELVMAGPIERPSLSDIKPDLTAARFLAGAGKGALGDDGLLSAIIGQLERRGFRVRGVDEVLGDMLVGEGPLGGHRPGEDAVRDIRRGLAVARAIGAQDVGQAVVVQQGLVLGVEAAEGTDRLLERCGALRRPGSGGVLVKIKKPQQERRADLPTIGTVTVEGAHAAGLAGIAVEAGATLVVDRGAVAAAADAAGLFVVGVAVEA